MWTNADPGTNDESSNRQADGAASWMLILRGAFDGQQKNPRRTRR